MKDYKLSEIKKICEEHPICNGCAFCQFIGTTKYCAFADGEAPCDWVIKEKDGDEE